MFLRGLQTLPRVEKLTEKQTDCAIPSSALISSPHKSGSACSRWPGFLPELTEAWEHPWLRYGWLMAAVMSGYQPTGHTQRLGMSVLTAAFTADERNISDWVIMTN